MLALLQTEICYYVKDVVRFHLKNSWFTKSHKFTDAKGPLLMTCKFLDFRRKQDIKFREMDRQMRLIIGNASLG